MVWTSEEVDKYVSRVQRTIGGTKEREMKSFSFAKLYKEARDYDNARRHLTIYISSNESDFRGHRMMGQLLEDTGNHTKALESYRRSLELNNTQNDLVLKVVELYCKVPTDPQRARVWADRAARLFPGNPAVFKLRMHLLECSGQVDYEEMEDLLSEEMVKRPREILLHIRLVRMYAATGRLEDAFSHCISVNGTAAFNDNLEWWTCAVEIFEKYLSSQERLVQEDQELNPGHSVLEAHSNLLWALCSVTKLHLSQSGTRECANALYRFDHSLLVAFKRKIWQSPQMSGSKENEWMIGLQEMRAHLYMHCGTSLINLAKENYLSWPRSLRMACACYANSVAVPEPSDTPRTGTTPKKKVHTHKWHTLACCRLSHVGHILTAVKNRHGEEWLENCILDGCTPQGLSQIISSIYDGKALSMSFLANDEEFQISEINLPDLEQLTYYDEVALGQNSENLQMLLWIGLHWYQLDKSMKPGVGVVVSRIFDGLMMDVHNIQHTAAESLCHRDLEAFIYAVVRTTAARLLEDQDVYYEDFQPRLLPQPLCSPFGLAAQSDWWSAAHSLYTGTARTNQSGKVRATVQKGLEKIRALGNHGLDVMLLVYLAKSFGEKGEYLKSSGSTPWHYKEHWKSLEDRSVHYWKQALVILEKLEKDESIPYCKDPLFAQLADIQKEEVQYNVQSARLTLGETAVREGRLEDAIALLEQVKTPRGIWNLAQVYKYLAGVEAQAAAEETGADCTESAREYYTWLNNARNLLLSGLQMLSPDDRRRETFQEGLNEIEDMLNADPTRINTSRKQLDFRQLDYQASRSSTTVSEVQDGSEDNFWVEQPQDSSTKDLIAKLSEVTLNNGYLQEQMALRDQQMSELADHVRMLQSEVEGLKHSRYLSDSTLATPKSSPVVSSLSGAGPSLMSTPLSRPTAGIKSRLGPIPQSVTPSPRLEGKIDSSFFAGLSKSNSPEVHAEVEEEVDGNVPDRRSRNVSVSSVASQDDGIHFEPLIPLPEKIEVETGEEQEEVMFTGRGKLFRFDKETTSWKERGIGNLKILHNSTTRKFRVLMRRENVHKVCANHFITLEMEVLLKAGSANSLMWTTFADFADEVAKVEQLAARFKTPEDATAFKDAFEEAQEALRNPVESASEDDEDEEEEELYEEEDEEEEEEEEDDEELADRFAPKPGAWSCSECMVLNSPETSKCVACGTAKLSLPVSISDASKMSFPFQSSQFSFRIPKPGSAPGSLATAPPHSAPSPLSFGTSHPRYSFGTPCTLSPDPVTTAAPVFTQSQSSNAAPAVVPTFNLAPFGVSASATSTTPPRFVFGAGSLSGGVAAPQPNKSFSFSTNPTSAADPGPSVFGSSSSKDQQVSFASFSPEAPPSFGVTLDVPADQTKAPQPVGKTPHFAGKTPEPVGKAPQPAGTGLFSFGTSEQSAVPFEKLFWQQPPGPSPFSQTSQIGPNTNGRFPASQALSFMVKSRENEAKGKVPSLQEDFAKSPPSSTLRGLLGFEEDSPYDFTPYVTETPDEGDASDTSQTQVKSDSVVEECDADEGDEVHDIFDESDSETEGQGSSNSSAEEEVSCQIESLPGSASKSPWTPVKMDSCGSPVTVKAQIPAAFSPQVTAGRRILTPRSTLRAAKKKDEDCVIIYEVRPSRAERERAASFLLPPNFYNYTRTNPCSGCRGCREGESGLDQGVEEERELVERPAEALQQQTSGEGGPIFGQSYGSTGLSFSSVAVTSKGAFGSPWDGGTFPQAGTQLFQGGDDGDDTAGDVHFEPVIPLPDEIKVVTGEEGLDVLFCERAKLYRFDKDNSAWKERGVGEIKLLWDRGTGCGRVIMRRDQIKKLCANHIVDAGAELKPNVGSDRSWVWNALDYSEGDAKPEQLAVRFKNPDLATRFKVAFDEVKQRRLENSETPQAAVLEKDFPLGKSDATDEKPSEERRETDVAFCASGVEDLKVKFAPSKGSWSCDSCYTQNTGSAVQCVACLSPRVVEVQAESQSLQGPEMQELASGDAPADPFVLRSTAGQKFGAAPAFAFGQATSSTFNFSMPTFTIGRSDTVTADEKEEEEQDKVGWSPTRISSPPKAESSSTPTTGSPQRKSLQTDLPFGTSSPCKFTFKMHFSPVSPSRKPKSPQSPTSPAGPSSPSSPGVESEDDKIHFEPLIPLPDKVERYTGEEKEVEVFCARAKLFRFDKDAAQWKERGIGDMKVLHHKESKTYRLLMRREHVFKICCNHRLTSDMKLKKMGTSEKALVWHTAADFADEEARPELLAIKFGSSDKAQEFKHAFEGALGDAAVEENKPDVVEEQAPNEGRKDDNHGMKAEKSEEEIKWTREGNKEDQVLHASPNPSVEAKESSSSQSSGFLFGSPSVSSLSFAAVAKKSPSTPFAQTAAQKSPGFPGVGQQLFGSRRKESDGDENYASHEDDGPHFEPIIALPEKIKVSTGEEDEEALFSHRAKLYRFDKDAKMWKERGVGDIKLLRSNRTGKIRVLMRRDQVLKICANHQVTVDTKLQPNAGSDKSWVWHTAADFAEEKPKPEQLAVKFKSADVAMQFKEVFDECLEILKLAGSQRSENQPKESSAQQSSSRDMFEKFKPKTGSWDCEICLVNNGSESTACVACGTTKPGSGDKETTLSIEETSGFDKFKPKAGSWDCEACLINNGSDRTTCVACETPKPGQDFVQSTTNDSAKFEFQFRAQAPQKSASGFTFGGKPKESDNADGTAKFVFGTTSAAPSAGSGFVFGDASSQTDSKIAASTTGFVFGTAPTTAVSKAADSTSSGGFVFGGPQNKTDPKPADSTSSGGFVFGGSQRKTDSKPADSTSSGEFLFGFKSEETGESFWECDGCYLTNNSDKEACVACNAPKPGLKPDECDSGATAPTKTDSKPTYSTSDRGFVLGTATTTAVSEAADSTSSGSGFVFGGSQSKTDSKPADSTSSRGISFGLKPEQTGGSSWECDGCYLNNSSDEEACVACNAPKPGLEPDECDSGATAPTKTDPKASSSTGFVFAGAPITDSTSSGGFVFDSTQSKVDPKKGEINDISEEEKETLEGASSEGAQSQAHTKVPSPAHADLENPDVISIDLELVEAPEPTNAEVERAEKLLLPKSFYLYERENQPSEKKKTSDKTGGRTDKKKESVEESVDTSSEAKDETLETPSDGASVFGGRSAGSLLSFASMAKSPPHVGDLFPKPSREGFKGQGAQLFVHRTNPGAEGEEYDPETEGEGADFQAIVSLPEVEKVTGEENEIVKFTHRAKLYRFNRELGQWKERGVGDIKILQHKESGRARVLMRRDQIHKLCANHYIAPSMELRPNTGSDRSWVWNAQDFSEEVMRPEQLAVKFKNTSVAENFRDVFYECQYHSGPVLEVTTENADSSTAPSDAAGEAHSSRSERDEENSERDEVESEGNEGKSEGDVGKSEGDEVKSEGNEGKSEGDEVKSEGNEGKSEGDEVKSKGDVGKSEGNEGKSEGDEEKSERDGVKSKGDEEKSEAEEVKSEGGEGHGKTSSGFLFGSPSISSLSFSDVLGNTFSSPLPSKETPLAAPVSPARSPGRPHEDEEGEASGEEDEASDGDRLHFEPIIPLPEKVDIVTGEEEEEVVFQDRCKLYRYDKESLQWKDRGVGNMKLLHDPRTGRARVVMRRDQVHKVCANHLITAQMDLKPNGHSEKAWTWQTLADVSDGGEGKVEELAVRFKTIEIAQEFKEKFEACQDVLNSDGEVPGKGEVSSERQKATEGAIQEERKTDVSTGNADKENAESPSSVGLVAARSAVRSAAELPTCSPEISRLLDEMQK